MYKSCPWMMFSHYCLFMAVAKLNEMWVSSQSGKLWSFIQVLEAALVFLQNNNLSASLILRLKPCWHSVTSGWISVVSPSPSESGSGPGQGPIRAAVCRSVQHHWDESTGGSTNPQHLHAQSWRDSEGTTRNRCVFLTDMFKSQWGRFL